MQFSCGNSLLTGIHIIFSRLHNKDKCIEESLNKINFSNLTILRGILAVYVLCGHSREIFFIGGTYLSTVKEFWFYDYFMLFILQYTTLGKEAVTIFFVLSGYSISHSLNRNTDIKKFYLNRLIRIYPTYIASVISLYFIVIFINNDKLSDYYFQTNIISSLFIYYEYEGILSVPYWSLIYEVIFYLSAPILLLLRVNLFILISIIFYIIGILEFGLGFRSADSVLLNFICEYLLYFSLGCWLYCNYDNVKSIVSDKINLYIFTIACMTFLIVLNKLGADKKLTMLLTSLISLYLIPLFEMRKIRKTVLPTHVFEASYSIYVFHYPLLIAISYFTKEILSHESYYSWIVPIPMVLFICVMYWFLCEKKINYYLSNRRV